jgi:RNA polymerase sigma-70 factor (ECF subfamily)
MSSVLDFESLVRRFERDLYQFALSLTGSEPHACDLVQETFYIWATKGSQLREPRMVKSWLFTTLHREFLQTLRHRDRYCDEDVSTMEAELPAVQPDVLARVDSATALQCLAALEERYRGPIALYYLEDYSYLEISSILGIPLGTVQSRIARGKAQLLRMLTTVPHSPQHNESPGRHS